MILSLSERLSSSYFMPECYLFLQLSFTIQNIIHFHSVLEGGEKIEKLLHIGKNADLTISKNVSINVQVE